MLEKATGTPRQVSPRDATVRRHFYSLDVEGGHRDPAVEEVLSLIEDIAAPIIRGLDDGEFPNGMQRLELAYYIALCWLRTPAWREQMASVTEQTTAAMVAESYRLDPKAAQRAFANHELEMTPEEIEEARVDMIGGLESGRIGVEFPKNATIKWLLDGIHGASLTMFMLDWTLVRLDDANQLIVADNPVSLHDPTPAFPEGGSGILSSPNSQMFLPIGTRTGILLQSNSELWSWARENIEALHVLTPEEAVEAVGPREGRWGVGDAPAELARELNLRSYATASRFIFGSQAGVQAVHAMRTSQAPRLKQVTPRGPRMHIVVDDDRSPTGLRIARTFKPKPRD